MARLAKTKNEGVSGLILGAGSGLRMGGLSKALLELQTQTLLERALWALAPFCSQLVVGLHPADLEAGEQLVAKQCMSHEVVIMVGGAERQETVLRLVQAATRPYVLLHEVARPFAQKHDFENVLEAAWLHGAAALYTPLRVRDGLALMQDGKFHSSLPRHQVVSMQTPHAYLRQPLLDAHLRATSCHHSEDSTVGLVQWAGYSVHLVPGSSDNIKITYLEDWERALATSDLSHPTVSEPQNQVI